ncbi:unnamed protein product [Rotaria socialis]|uniref:HAT C-terminal dimerisation domain-containing protein n=1 Tax=Rotaria socialis TaxID=392032 RepID=A0A818C9R9_9BILA|nr:unnamed protein product [Rotaria socialis]CAF4783080.1 unnamed protein product [Rotaria socialis]
MDADIHQGNTNKKGNPMRSPVWQYFKRISINGVYRTQCLENGCDKTLALINWTTSPLFKHLRDVHKIHNLKKNSNGRVFVGRVKHKLAKTKKKKLDNLAVEAIIKDGRSFNDFNKTGLKQFLQYAIPGYKPVHRNNVQQKLRSLYYLHHKLLENTLSNVSDIAITLDFWSDKKLKSYLVLTGHFLDEDFQSKSTILQFSSFDQRNFSDLIGEEIEKQLVDLNIFDKITTITCDNAPNMLGLFNHLSRDIKRIPCVAHVLHLTICNALGIWQEGEDNDLNRTTDKSNNNISENEFDEGLTQSVRKMSLDGDISGQQNNQESDEQDVFGDETSEDEVGWDDEDKMTIDNEGGEKFGDEGGEKFGDEGGEKFGEKGGEKGGDEYESDGSDFEKDEIEDNFQVGLKTSVNDVQDDASTTAEQQIAYVLRKCRRLVSTIKYSNVFQLYLKDLINEYNNAHEKKIKRSLQLDVKSRWSSTHYMLEAFQIFRPIIDSLFKNIRKMNLSKNQTNSLHKLEMSNTSWDMVELLLKALGPFKRAIKLISGSQYPTAGLALFIIRRIQQTFLENVRSNDGEMFQRIKQLIHEKLIYYTTDKYGEGFTNLIIHAYFEPHGLSVLTQKEIASTERQLRYSTRHLFSDQQSTMMSGKQKRSALDMFLDSIDGDTDCVSHSTNKTSTSTSTSCFTNEAKKYRQLASNFMSDDREDKSAALFWKCNQHSLPMLSILARKYLATPATSVPSESAFSKSAYYGRKERANINANTLSQSVFLKDKLMTEK